MRRLRWSLSVLLLAAAAPEGAPAQEPHGPCASLRVRDARCSVVTVPENRGTRKGRAIQIRVVVLPATGETRHPDPLFFLAGGPGQAASDLAPGHVNNPLRASRDLVFMDQRGTGGSNPLACAFYRPEDEASGRFAEFLPIDRVRACRAELERAADLAQYTTAASVADLEDVRAHLGYARVNLWGGSYGTRLAMEYVRAHAGRVRAVVLEGPVPSSLAMPDGFGRAAQRSLDGLNVECLATELCATRAPDAARDAARVFERLKQGPVTARAADGPTEYAMTRDHVAESIRYMTYTTRTASRVPALLTSAASGNFSAFATHLRDLRRNDGVLGGLYLSITCAEDVPFLPPEAAERDRDTYLGDYRIRQQQAACAEWPRGAVPAWHRTPVTADVPVLVVVGMLDPATPPPFADEVAKTLRNSVVVKVPSGGHSFAGLIGTTCIETLKRQVFENGSVEGLDTACVGKIRRDWGRRPSEGDGR